MTHFLFEPDTVVNLALLVMNVAVLGYLVSIRGKSRATWWLVAVYGALSVYALGAVVNTTLFTDDPVLWRLLGGVFFVSTGVALWAMMGFAYRILEAPFPREARWVTAGTGGLLALHLAVVVGTFVWAPGQGRPALLHAPLMLAFMAWATVVLVRKRRWAKRTGRAQAARAFGSYALINVLLVAFLGEQALVNAGVLPVFGASRVIAGIGFLGFFFGFAAVYLAHAPEPTTLQAKLVGLALATALAVTSGLVTAAFPFRVVPDALPAMPQNQALRYTPDGAGGYTLDALPARPVVPRGGRLGLANAADTTVALGFAFPFYGRPQTEATVDNDPVVTFGGSARTFREFAIARPAAVVPLGLDLDPSRGGGVFLERAPRRATLTWVRAATVYGRGEATVQLVLHADGRIDFVYGDVSPTRGLLGRGILPGGTPLDRAAPLDAALPARVAPGAPHFENYQLAYLEAAHARVAPLVWLTLGASAFVVLVFPLFFRGSLLRPLRDLLAGVRRVDAGDLGVAVPVGTPDEFGRLAAGFNGMTASLRDHTERLEELVAERTAELEAAQGRLLHAEKMASLGALTAGIAHEIKNPLNFVTNFAGLTVELADELAATTDPAERQALLDDIRQNAGTIEAHGRRADAIVASMMAHARNGTGERRPVDLDAFVDEHVDLAWHGQRARDPGAEAAIVRDYGGAGAVEGVPQELGRVLVNLLSNAFDAVAERAAGAGDAYAPTVTVSTRAAAGGVEVRVADNGPGMAPDVAAKVFEPFFTTKPPGQGTGLGLSLSHDIVAQGHGGTLAVETAEGEGATFVLTLPRG
ncbi:ATP-binding protein [Rubrivirga sp. IMCC43871]|uniref:ATP-binding protein n=1 Tax=Rubrivirga sp. IMCC43871 TaxID=3391575 RepID=UPI00398FED26